MSAAMTITKGAGHVEVSAIKGQVILYIPALDHHIAFSPDEAVQFATVVLERVKIAISQGTPV
jgi:hypothetical protein